MYGHHSCTTISSAKILLFACFVSFLAFERSSVLLASMAPPPPRGSRNLEARNPAVIDRSQHVRERVLGPSPSPTRQTERGWNLYVFVYLCVCGITAGLVLVLRCEWSDKLGVPSVFSVFFLLLISIEYRLLHARFYLFSFFLFFFFW
ncbi:hypothetical protein BDZ94DRAFT_1275106 [Collybia nuda]|uniref:Uncharacterized protein n=1 Tax=Collybia nuda TaxID=64659 RepID=A0A9P6C8V6_9AGAR|nr:hypothetical protein BDZ94DRAFT_1275106 [Collybia nuda]